MALSKRLRYEILRRDNFACRYCGATAPDAKLTVDHVVPEAPGGGDDPSNLVAACSDCNSGKSATPPDAELVADVAQDALRWRKAMEVAREITERDHEAKAAFAHEFYDYWNTWTWTDSRKQEHTFDLPPGWELRIGELMTAGLSVADMKECVDTALSAKWVKNEFAYFVGTARNKITNRQNLAQEVIRQGMV